MKRLFKSRFLALMVMVAMVVGTARCGLIIYKERRDRKPPKPDARKIDPAVLIMDCAWLLVGIIPGAVALIIDFATGGVYLSGKTSNLRSGDSVAFRFRGPAPVDANIMVIVEDRATRKAVSSLFMKDVSRGEELEDKVILSIPESIDPGAYNLALKIDGVTKASWGLNIEP